MSWHGHSNADFRNLELHKAALDKLKRNPELLTNVLALLDRWLGDVRLQHASRWLTEWKRLLTNAPIEEVSRVILDPERGQVYRQCSPLGPVFTPAERWAVLERINSQLRSRVPQTTT